jgi:hypothetical protein
MVSEEGKLYKRSISGEVLREMVVVQEIKARKKGIRMSFCILGVLKI